MVLYEGFPANSCSWQPKENIENTKHLKDFEAKEEKSVQQASKKSKRAEMQQTRANKKEAAAVAIKVEAPEPTREGMQWTAREEAQLAPLEHAVALSEKLKNTVLLKREVQGPVQCWVCG